MTTTTTTTAAQFTVDDHACTLADLLAANADDDALCEWAQAAAIGDRFPAIVECVRVS